MTAFIPEPVPDFAFLLVFGSVYFGIVSRRRRPPKSKNPPKKWQHLSESLAAFHRNGWQGLRRIIHGVFYKPKQSVFGELRPSETEIIKPYLFDQGKRNAYITGTALYNNLGLTTQVPKTVKIASRSKRIYISSGSIKAKPVKSYVDVTEENYYLLEILDVLKDFTKIPDLDKKGGILFLQNKLRSLTDKEINRLINFALQYPPRVRAFLGALLTDITGLENNSLKQSVNPLTTYDFGINKELLETAPNWNIK